MIKICEILGKFRKIEQHKVGEFKRPETQNQGYKTSHDMHLDHFIKMAVWSVCTDFTTVKQTLPPPPPISYHFTATRIWQEIGPLAHSILSNRFSKKVSRMCIILKLHAGDLLLCYVFRKSVDIFFKNVN